MDIKTYAKTRFNSMIPALSQKGKVRTQMGIVQAASMVNTSADNLSLLTGGKDPIAESVKMFSAKDIKGKRVKNSGEVGMPAFANNGEMGMASVQGLQTVSAIDITIQMLVYSFVPFMAIERPMTDSTTTISWKSLVATNNGGGLTKGDHVIGNFKPENSSVNLGSPIKKVEGVGAGDVLTLDLGGTIYEGTVLVQLTDTGVNSGEPVVGKDYDGVVLFPGTTTAFNVDYENGILTSTGTVATTTTNVTAQAMVDMWSDSTASNVLRTTTKMNSVQMVARETGVIIEDSVDRMMFILKALNQSEGAMTLEQYMSQMMFDLYVAYVNNLMMIGLHTRSAQLEGTDELVAHTVDLSAYGSQIIADPVRKYDELSTLVNTMNNTMLKNANLGITALIVGSRIANLMGADSFRFTKSDTYSTQMNTLIGVYDNIPVLRHEYIDRFIDNADSEGYGNIFGIHRDPNGEVGFLAYGEYLPIHTTNNVYNFENPLQFAKALVSFVGTKIIEPALCTRGKFRITDPTGTP